MSTITTHTDDRSARIAKTRALLAEVAPGTLGAFDRLTRTPEEQATVTAAAQAWHEELLAAHPVADPDGVRSVLRVMEDREAALRFVLANVPTHPMPTGIPGPKWATEVDAWTWITGDNTWQRKVSRPFLSAEGAGIVLESWQAVGTDGVVENAPLEVDVLVDSIDGDDLAEAARETAHWLLEAADIVEGPARVDLSSRERGTRGTPTQYLVTQAVRRILTERPISQNELAVATGYGQDELSQLMTGRRRMDLADVERIAHGLDIFPFELMEHAASRQAALR